MTFKDHFSEHAANYASARPGYPQSMFDFIVKQCQRRHLAWDCATGNGQAALALSPHFDKVIASDASQQQLDEATAADNIHYQCVAAESFTAEPGSVDLVTVAQALHWFNIDLFFQRVDNVLGPGGLLAVWSYELTSVTPAIDCVVQRLYADIVGSYWPAERRLVETAYRDIAFPYAQIPVPTTYMQCDWSSAQFLNYLMSWSATRRYMKDLQANPVDLVRDELLQAWAGEDIRAVRWPLNIKLCRK